MRGPLPYFIDTGAWIALAISSDPLHNIAKEKWQALDENGAKRYSSIPIILETFTFMSRHTNQATALRWKDEALRLERFEMWECTTKDLQVAWKWFLKKDLLKLSAVDATSFTLMEKHKVRRAFTFDGHFSTAGFLIV